MKVGTKVRTLYEHSETGTVCKPAKAELPLPSSDWRIVRFDADGLKLCIHRSMLSVRNS